MTRYGREARTSVTFCGRETNSGRWAGGVQEGESGVVLYGGEENKKGRFRGLKPPFLRNSRAFRDYVLRKRRFA